MGISLFLLTALGVRWSGIRINLSSSIPEGLYRERGLSAGSLRRGDAVLACLPSHMARFGRERGYLPRGPCPGGAMPVGKLVLALPGDTVIVDNDGLKVNGVWIAGSRPRRVDHRGRPLPQLAHAAYAVGTGQLWLGSRSEAGFDSRYFGAIPSTSVIAELTALWLLPPDPAAHHPTSGLVDQRTRPPPGKRWRTRRSDGSAS